MLGLIPKPYLVVALVVGLIALMGGTFAKGASWGRAQATSRCNAEKIEVQQREIAERAVLQAAIDKRDAELRAKEQERANAIVQVRTEFLPAKTVVRKEVVERRVFTDCRIGDGMRDTLNAALRGRPAATVPALGAGDAGVSGGARAAGG